MTCFRRHMFIKSSRILLILFLAWGVSQGSLGRQDDVTLDTAMKTEVVEGVAKLLVDNYIFPETAEKMAENVKGKLAEGKYDDIKDVNDFAIALTRDLREVSKDKHIRVFFSPETVRRIRASQSVSAEERERQRKANIERQRQSNFGFKKLEILSGNIGYLDLTGFSGMDEAAPTIFAAMQFLANSNAVIIDLRNNGGGSPFTIQLISSYFFEEKTHLNSFEWRGDDLIKQFWTQLYVPGRKMYDTDLYLLTSSSTFSAAEEFTYNLKNLERATIVGETTGGGAHPGGSRIVNDYFTVWVPAGRAINPITKTNWEGTGIEPHIEISRDKALEKAHFTALEKLAEKAADDQAKRRYTWAMDGLKAKLEPADVDEALLKKYVGKYTRGEVALVNGQLYFTAGPTKYKLIPLKDNYFIVDGWDVVHIEFILDETGKEYNVKAHLNDGSSEIVRRVKK